MKTNRKPFQVIPGLRKLWHEDIKAALRYFGSMTAPEIAAKIQERLGNEQFINVNAIKIDCKELLKWGEVVAVHSDNPKNPRYRLNYWRNPRGAA